MKSMFVFSALIILFTLTGCGRPHKSSAPKHNLQKRILTDEEKTRLVTATIYYTPDYSLSDSVQCEEKINLNILDNKNKVTVYSLCKKIVSSCRMQGSCIVNIDNTAVLINYHKKQNNVVYFKKVNTADCPYGLGDSSDKVLSFKTICLDPYKSVAADLSIYRLGDVIYMPDLVGIVLPSGQIHDGYLIVRDSGGNIKGVGRFDFFTGFQGTSKKINPFARLGLGGGKFLNYEHFNFDHSVSLSIRQQHQFPFIKK